MSKSKPSNAAHGPDEQYNDADALLVHLLALSPAQRAHFLAIVAAQDAFDADPTEERYENLKRVARAKFGCWTPS